MHVLTEKGLLLFSLWTGLISRGFSPRILFLRNNPRRNFPVRTIFTWSLFTFYPLGVMSAFISGLETRAYPGFNTKRNPGYIPGLEKIYLRGVKNIYTEGINIVVYTTIFRLFFLFLTKEVYIHFTFNYPAGS